MVQADHAKTKQLYQNACDDKHVAQGRGRKQNDCEKKDEPSGHQQRQTGQTTDAMIDRYDREADLFIRNISGSLGL